MEEAVRLVEQHGGEVTVLTLGPAEAEEQLRDTLAIGADRGILLATGGEEWDPQATAGGDPRGDRGRACRGRDVRPDRVRQRVGRLGRLPGRHPRRARARPADRHRPQGAVGRGRPRALRAGGHRRARRLPAAAARRRVRAGGHQPAPLPVRAREAARAAQAGRDGARPRGPSSGWRSCGSSCRRARASRRRSSARAPRRRPPSSASCASWGWRDGTRPDRARGRPGRRALPPGALARPRPRRGPPLEALLVGPAPATPPRSSARTAWRVRTWPRTSGSRPTRRGAWARCVAELVERLDAGAVVAAGTNRGNEVLAHVAARLDLPLRRQLHGILAGRAAHGHARALGRQPARGGARPRRRCRCCPWHRTPSRRSPRGGGRAGGRGVHAGARRRRPGRAASPSTSTTSTSGISLAEAKVVVSGGRGVGSADGFGILEELAGLLDAAVGCSRVVTSAGWRPHTDQVGQTGTKVSPDLYIACGISGATQHIAGCKGAKKILAINSDAEAPILANADYAVIGDLTEIVPAITAELRKVAGHSRRVAGARRARRRARGQRHALRPPRQAARRPRAAGQAGRALRRRAAARAQRGEIVLGQRKLLQRLGPGLDARGDLLGLPRPLPDDRASR